jgi:hypothetical protein
MTLSREQMAKVVGALDDEGLGDRLTYDEVFGVLQRLEQDEDAAAPTDDRADDFDLATIDAWPADLDRTAYLGVAGKIVDAIEPHTEASPVALLVHVLAFAGVALGRGPHFYADGSRHGLNENVVVVGETSKARKGTARAHISGVFEAAVPTFMERVKSGLSSAEGLVDEIRDEAEGATGDVIKGQPDKRICVVETEFASALRMLNREGNVLSPTIRDAWDGREADQGDEDPLRRAARGRHRPHHQS